MRNILISVLWLILGTVNGYSQFQNVVVGTENYPEEPSIMFDPGNPMRAVAGSNIDNYYYSVDGGITWTHGILTSTYGVWGDPCIIVDTAGDFYFFHLSNPVQGNWIDRIVCQKSTDGGMTWNNGTYMGLNGAKAQDKEWAVVNPVNNDIYVTWTQFDNYGSTNPGDSSVILFSRSTDGGTSWSQAKRISKVAGDCIDSDNTDEGAVPAVGPEGEVYVSWAGPLGLVFTRSLDGGLTWPEDNTFVCDIPGGWDYAIPGIFRANGLPVTCCDLSNGPHRGTIYINWSDQRNGETDTDVFLVKSEDGGATWSVPIRVNDDPPGRQQFFTWMTVDQATGYVYIVFYDRRNHPDNQTDVYLAVSRDGGETFENMVISETPFSPDAAVFFGDYTNIAANNGIVRPIWARLEGGDLSVLTALVDSLFLSAHPGKEITVPMTLDQNFPNPAQDYTTFTYTIHQPCRVSLKLFDFRGAEVATIVDNRFHLPGKYLEHFDLSKKGLAPGFYYFSLISDEQVLKKKMLVD